MGLIAAAFVGSVLVGRRGQTRHGLASGSEPVLVGFLLGPTVLGLVTPGLLEVFTPLAQVGLGWLALIVGPRLRLGGPAAHPGPPARRGNAGRAS